MSVSDEREQSEDSTLDMEGCCEDDHSLLDPALSIHEVASGAQHAENSGVYFSWPTSHLVHGAAEGRANYFANLQKGVLPMHVGRLPKGQQASTLLDLMTIRAFHSKILRRFSLGTAVGFRIRNGNLTDIPAILVFVSRKVNQKWLSPGQCLPAALEGPGGVWCDVDVVEFSYYGAPAQTPKEQLYDELVDSLRGSDHCIDSGSQVANQETYGTLSAIVRRRTGNRQVGFLTNQHVAVDLDYPNQKMFHPLPPSLGPGVYLGAVERATSFISDDVWYGIYAGTNPDTFVRADGAFVPFADDFDISSVSTLVKGIGEVGNVKSIDLQSSIGSLVGKRVSKVGRSSGLTTGIITAYSLEYNDEKGISLFSDLLVVGENRQNFDLEGDSGSLILMTGEEDGEKPRPVGIIWGGTANRGRLKLKRDHGPETWTSGVDLGRLLDRLNLEIITTDALLQDAVHEQRCGFVVKPAPAPASPCLAGQKSDDQMYEPLGISIQQLPRQSSPELESGRAEDAEINVEEHQFISGFNTETPAFHRSGDENADLSALSNASDGDMSTYLHLGNREPKRRRRAGSASSIDLEK